MQIFPGLNRFSGFASLSAATVCLTRSLESFIEMFSTPQLGARNLLTLGDNRIRRAAAHF